MSRRRAVAVPLLLLAAHCCSSSSSRFAAAVGDQEIMEAAEECFPGWNLVHGQCVKEMARKPLSRCPPKASFVDGHCLIERVVRPSLVCSGSQSLVGDKCEFEEQMAALSSCPKGFIFDGRGCMRSQEFPGAVECPVGFRVSLESPQSCVRESKQRASYICPPGAELFGMDKCRQRETVGPAKSCGLGFALDAGDRCMKVEYLKMELRCAPGQKLEDGVCRSSRKVPANALCPADHTFDGRECIKVTLADPTPSCPPAFTYSDGRCVRVLEKEPSFLCPLGFELTEGKCSKRSSVKAAAECPEGSIGGVILGKTYCEQVEALPPTQSCPLDHELEADRCVKRTTGRVMVHCPLGFLPSGDGCVREVTLKPTEVCSSGSTLRDGFCIVTETVPSKPACDADGSVTPQGTCVRLYTADLLYSCPKGFSLAGSSCIRKSHAQAAAFCPPNTQMRGADCVATDTQQAAATCESGFEPDQKGFCVKFDSKPPKKTCPKTHKLFNHYCVKRAELGPFAGLGAL